MKTTTYSSFALFVGLALGTAAAQAGINPEWQLHRPGMTGIPGDYVQAIYVDPEDQPYIAAYIPFWEEGGLGHFDGERWTTVNNVDSPILGSPRFNEILRGPNGMIWIASDRGLLRYDPVIGPSSLVKFDRTNTPMPGDQIRDIDFAPDGTLWIAIFNAGGLPGGGLVRFNPATSQWTVWTTANGITWGGDWPGWDEVDHVAVVPDAAGPGYTIWFGSPNSLGMGTWRDGAFTWLGNPQDLPASRYPLKFMTVDPVDDDGNVWLLTSQGLARRARDGTYTPISYPAGVNSQLQKFQPLRNGRAIIATFYADVFLYNGASWQFLGNWGGGTHTYALAEDSQGRIWAGGIGGAARWDGSAWQRYRLTNTGMLSYFVDTISLAPDGRVFINGNGGPGVGGFNIFDGVHWTGVNNHNYGLGPAFGFPTDDVASLFYRANGHLLLAPRSQGAADWDGTSYTQLIPLGTSISVMTEDGLGRVWAGGDNGGLFHEDEFGQILQTPFGRVLSIEKDPAAPGFVWVCNLDAITRTDGSTYETWPRSLLGIGANTLEQQLQGASLAPDGTLWIASGSGLFHLNPSDSTFSRFTTANSGLPSNGVYRVKVAPDGAVWVYSEDDVPPYTAGLSHFDGTTWTTFNTANSPLRGPGITCLETRSTPDGYELWVGMATQGVAVLSVRVAPRCSADFDNDGDTGTDADIEAFFACLAGHCCSTCATSDFDGDGDSGTDADIEAFFRVLAGEDC